MEDIKTQHEDRALSLRTWKILKAPSVGNFEGNTPQITIEVNKKVIKFLGVTVDLCAGRHRPFLKLGKHTNLYQHKRQ